MTLSRSFAPREDAAADALSPAAPPAFPMWPFAFTAYAEHCSRDYAGYFQRLSKADDALAVLQADEALGLELLNDMGQAMYALFWGPVGEAMAAVRGTAPPAL